MVALSLKRSILGDKVEHVCWKFINTHFNSCVKYVIFHCGTNNLQHHTPSQICDAFRDVNLHLRRYYPSIQVLVSGILPRFGHFYTDRVAETNNQIREMCRTSEVSFIDHSGYSDQDGHIRSELYYHDWLHLNEEGNYKLALEFRHAIYLKKIAGEKFVQIMLISLA